VKLNHINLTVANVPAAADFLQKYCGLAPAGGNAGMAFLEDGHGFVVSLMKANRKQPTTYPGNFHIGFFVGSDDTVDEVHRRLKEDGFAVPDPERHHTYGFYVEAPGGFTVEIGA
jgi:lactoylglutathione lyase